MYCTNCGKQIPDDAQFCRYCGATFAKNAAANYKTSANAQPVSSGKKPFNLKLVLIPLLLLLVVGGIFFVLNRNGEEDSGKAGKDKISKIIRKDAEGNINLYLSDFRYDKSGKIIKCNYYNAKDEITHHEERIYDSKGNFIVALRYGVDTNTDSYLYLYEKEIQEHFSWGFLCDDIEEGKKYKYDCEYDKKGNLTEAVMKDEAGDVLYTFVREYDEKGNNTRFEIFSGAGYSQGNVLRTYDVKNKLVELSLIANEQTIFKYKMKYDDSSGLLQETEEDFFGTVSHGVYEYDDNGRIIKYTNYDLDGNIEGTYEYIYQ